MKEEERGKTTDLLKENCQLDRVNAMGMSRSDCIRLRVIPNNFWLTLLDTLVRQKKIPYWMCQNTQTFPSQDVCFQRQSLQRCFNYFGRNQCNQHIFSVCFQVSKMCEKAPQNILNCKEGTCILKIVSR